jgi:hypothetical protein
MHNGKVAKMLQLAPNGSFNIESEEKGATC